MITIFIEIESRTCLSRRQEVCQWATRSLTSKHSIDNLFCSRQNKYNFGKNIIILELKFVNIDWNCIAKRTYLSSPSPNCQIYKRWVLLSDQNILTRVIFVQLSAIYLLPTINFFLFIQIKVVLIKVFCSGNSINFYKIFCHKFC